MIHHRLALYGIFFINKLQITGDILNIKSDRRRRLSVILLLPQVHAPVTSTIVLYRTCGKIRNLWEVGYCAKIVGNVKLALKVPQAYVVLEVNLVGSGECSPLFEDWEPSTHMPSVFIVVLECGVHATQQHIFLTYMHVCNPKSV